MSTSLLSSVPRATSPLKFDNTLGAFSGWRIVGNGVTMFYTLHQCSELITSDRMWGITSVQAYNYFTHSKNKDPTATKSDGMSFYLLYSIFFLLSVVWVQGWLFFGAPVYCLIFIWSVESRIERLMDTADSALSGHTLYYYLVTHYGDLLALLKPTWYV